MSSLEQIKAQMEAEGWEHAGEIGVDSCSVFIGDPQFFSSSKEVSDDIQRAWHDQGDDAPEPVVPTAGGMGVVFMPGDGDGGYPVFVQRMNTELADGRISAVMVRFDAEDD